MSKKLQAVLNIGDLDVDGGVKAGEEFECDEKVAFRLVQSGAAVDLSALPPQAVAVTRQKPKQQSAGKPGADG